jgi:hypothetical protein
MSPYTGLGLIFVVSIVIGFTGILTHFIVLVALYRMRIPMNFFMTGMPSYFLRLSRELPPSVAKSRLLLLEKWSVIAFLVCVVGAGISGPMLGSLHESEKSNSRLLLIAH